MYDIDAEIDAFTFKFNSNGVVDVFALMAFNTIGLDGPSPGTIVITRGAVLGPCVADATCDATNVNEPNPFKVNV